jgi:RHS repeat-associated protein
MIRARISATIVSTGFGYDAIGNLVQKTSSGPAGAPADQRLNLGEVRYGENGAGPHAVTTAGGIPYRYDANGNLASKGDTTYQWNPRDLLVAADDGTSSSTYQYDASSQRVKQRVQQGTVITTTLYPDGSSELRGNELIFYVFDDEARIAELRKPFNAGQLLQGFSDQATTMPHAGTKRWYIGDHLGSTQLILDERAAVIAEKVYYPFGLSRFAQNGGAAPYGYTGKELDASGLHYYEARYYDALVGRFISVDPLYLDKPQAGAQNPQLLNLYAYGLNNPLKYVDPNGASPVQQLKIPLSNGFQHPRQYLVFEMEIQDYSAYGAGSFQQGVHVQAKMAVVTQRGDKWTVVGQPQPVMLKFTALPNSKVQSLAGTQFKDVIKPQTVKSTGMCIGNMCAMAYTASGGRVRNMETQAMMGKFSLLSPDGKSAVPLDKFNAEACTVADAFFFKHETGYREQMPTQYGIGAGVGVTDGKDPEASSHIIGGPTTGSLRIDSSNLKVKDSPH